MHITKFTFSAPRPRFLFRPLVFLSRCRPRGHAGARVYTTAQVWVPAGLRGACSGRSQSRNLASNRGEAFRRVRAKQDDGSPTVLHDLFCCCCCCCCRSMYFITPSLKLSCGSHGSITNPHQSLAFCDGHRRCICLRLCVCHGSCRRRKQEIGTNTYCQGAVS